VNVEGNFLNLKLYPPLKNAMEGMHIVKGGNVSEYWAKVNALSKPRHNHLSSTLGFTRNINLATQVKEGDNTTLGYFNLRHRLK
jgi:hypothetical protein